ncbi:MAG TPA: methylated-DNA--[protein]-cysteine S-methyltransferase, partial [Acidimicrobiales bacterium]|nr:methylated-DNA--[protein]-cysteine S-methyltransferase [Acidimicrobiales bacterium]
PAVAQALDAYFAGDLAALSALRVDLTGRTPFTRDVVTTLAALPASELVTYGRLAAMAGYPGRARAVGRAMASNPLPVVIPCHRVLAGDGSLGGYSGGTDVKRWLLAHEGHEVAPRSGPEPAQAWTGSPSSTPSRRR